MWTSSPGVSRFARLETAARRAAGVPDSTGEFDRYDHRVLRFLYLRDGRGIGFPHIVLSQARSGHRDAAVVRDLRAGLLRTAHRVGPVRTFRRSHRTQGDAGDGAADHG